MGVCHEEGRNADGIAPKMILSSKDKYSDIHQFALNAAGSSGRLQLWLGRRRWGLDVFAEPCLHSWKANPAPLFCCIHRCLEHSLEDQAFVLNPLSGHLQSFCFTQHGLAPLL